jgi:hypothetical protein
MTSQDTMKMISAAIDALWSIDLDALKEAIREELMAEVRDEIRQETIDEIRGELESAVQDADSSDAPEIGTESAWGKDDTAGLNAFLAVFNENW